MYYKLYDEELYNKEIKEKYLSKYPKKTQAVYGRIFQRSAKTENLLERDLYDFNFEEISDLLRDLNPFTFAASEHNARIIASYISWAIEQGYRENNINPLRVIDKDFFKKFINRSFTNLISIHDLEVLENICVNAQDAVIFRLLFEGVWGKGYSELLNLRKKDIQGNILRLQDDDGKERELKVGDECIGLIEEALEQKKYAKNNGLFDNPGNINPEAELVKNDFVIRSSITNTASRHGNQRADKHLIIRRIKTIRKFHDEEKFLKISPKNVSNSGKLYYAKQLLERDGVLGKEQYLEICKRFGSTCKHWYTLKREISEENIRKIYK